MTGIGRAPGTKRQVWVVLAAFNEAGSLAILLEGISNAMIDAGLPYTAVLVDDGSTDSTYQIACDHKEQMPLQVLQHDANLGLGATIRDGLWHAADQANPRDVIVTLDADNTHTPDLITRMVRMIREGHDVVIASRYRPGSRVRGVTVARRILSRSASILLRILFPLKGVRDYTSGYRAYKAEAIQELIRAQGPNFRKEDGFQVMVDILLTLRTRRDLIFGEAPLILRYDQKEGASKMDVSRTVRDTLRLIWLRRTGSRLG